MKRAIISDDVYATGEDHSANGEYMVEAVGNVVGDAVGYPHHYAAVTVSQPQGNATTVRINPGRLFLGDKLYDLDEPFDIDLQPRLPIVVGDKVWVAILLRGDAVIDEEQRLVLTDADTGDTDPQSRPVRERYTIIGNVQAGIAGPTPLKPSVAETECVVAWVRLATTGIDVDGIEMNPEHRVKSLYEVEGRLRIIEFKFSELEQTVATLRTDLSAVAAAQRDAVRKDIFEQHSRDLAGMRRALRLFEQEPRASFYDPALTTEKWDTSNSQFLARIDEGIRFRFASYRDSQLALLDAANPDVIVTDNLLLPKFEEVVKLSVEGGTGSKNMSQLVHTEVTAVKRTVSRTSIETGPIVTVCENQRDWATVGEAARTGSKLAVNGETFQVVGLSTNKQSADWNANPASVGHKNYDVQKVSINTYTRTYWDYVTETFGLNGSVYGQTWLNSQAMVMTGIRVRFTRIGNDGDVHLVVCECREDGSPDITNVLARSTVLHEDLAVGRVRFGFQPVLPEPGKRYAWFVVTTGNHQIAFVANNKFAEGSMFQISDGIWAQGSITEDFEFDVLGAKFASTRTVVEFQPLTLDGGMNYIRLLAAGWAPDGTSSVWEYQLLGENTWRAITPDNADSLYGLPALIRLRLVMVGTTDLAPAIILDSAARGETGRSANDLVALTKAIDFGLTTTSVTVDLVIDQWKQGEHTAELKLISGGQTYAATSTSVWQDPEKPKRRRLTANFTELPTISQAVARIEGTKAGIDEWFGENLFVMAN